MVVKAYKQAKRKDDDIAIVTAGMRASLDKDGLVKDVSLAYGGCETNPNPSIRSSADW